MKKVVIGSWLALAVLLAITFVFAESNIQMSLTGDVPFKSISVGLESYTIELISSTDSAATIKVHNNGTAQSKEVELEPDSWHIGGINITVIEAKVADLSYSVLLGISSNSNIVLKAQNSTSDNNSSDLVENGTSEDVVPSINNSEEANESESNDTLEDRISEDFCSSGCSLGNDCVSVGYRKSGEYCSLNNSFVLQSESSSICENNFECDSNVCVSGQCVEGNLIQKILAWFKNLFG